MKHANLMVAVGLIVTIAGCGGGGTTNSTPPVTTPPTPAVTIEATGNGDLVIHPSSNPTFAIAIEVPVRVRETGGGTANWNWARLALTKSGVEIERKEIGADALRSAGLNGITARQDKNYTLTYHFNSTDFDIFTVTLGFQDLKDARQFEAQIPNTSFSGITVNLTPLARPGPIVRLDK